MVRVTVSGRLLVIEGDRVPYGRQPFVLPKPYKNKLKPAVRWLFRVWRKDVIQWVSVGELHQILK